MKTLSGTRILIVGCGDVGSRLATTLHRRGASVTGLRRQVDKLPGFVVPLAVDICSAQEVQVLQQQTFDYVVVCSAAGSFSEERYRQVYLDGLQNVLTNLSAGVRRIFLASSTSVYHQGDGQWVDESSDLAPQGFAGQTQLAAEQLLSSSDFATTVLRFGGIYGPGRHRLIQQVLAGEGSPSGPPLYSNRIHSDDAAGVFAFLIEAAEQGRRLADCYVCVDSEPAPLHEVKNWIAEKLGVAAAPLQQNVGQNRRASKRCSNQRLLNFGYRFRYPGFREGYGQLLADEFADLVES